MAEPFRNVYEDAERARAYADLGFPGTYYLAFRDIPALLSKDVTGSRALDFGCGTGRSTRFLRDQGMTAVGVDISGPMLEEARRRDPAGVYRLMCPLATGAEPIRWVSETTIAPWSIYVLADAGSPEIT